MRGFRVELVFACCALGLGMSPEDSRAQNIWSVIVGPTWGTISSDDFPDASIRRGFFAGVGLVTELGDNWTVTPYVAYVQKGAEFDGGVGLSGSDR